MSYPAVSNIHCNSRIHTYLYVRKKLWLLRLQEHNVLIETKKNNEQPLDCSLFSVAGPRIELGTS